MQRLLLVTVDRCSRESRQVSWIEIYQIGPLNHLQPVMLLLDVDICSVIHSYTDGHNVDEDLTASSVHGDHWRYGDSAGITRRCMDSYPSGIYESVASM